MSITDIAVGRMTRPAGSFGVRRTPPAPAISQPKSRFDWNLARARLGLVKARLAARLEILALSFTPRPRKIQAEEAAAHALLRSDVSATGVRLLAYLGALAVLAVGIAEILRTAPESGAIQSKAPAEWIDVARSYAPFALPMSELADSGYSYGMRRHTAGGGRRDIMTWGELESRTPHLMVEIYRPGDEIARFGSAQREIAARTDGLVSAMDVTPAGRMESKFGPVSLVEFTVQQEPARYCLGFARPFDQPRLQIVGWYCTSGSKETARDVAACALDRLTLLAAGGDARVGELFARAELKRNFCGQRSPLFAATPKLGPSAAIGPDTKMRGHIGASRP